MDLNTDINEIIAAAATGDNKAHEQLIEIATPKIKAYIYRSTLDKNATDDILQEVFFKMFQALGNLNNTDAFWGWLYRIASNCIKTHYRTKSKHSALANSTDDIINSIENDDHSAEKKLISKELSVVIAEAIAKLKPKHRQIVNLRCFEEMPFKEISRIEQISEVHSRIIFHRATEKLRIALNKKGFKKASIAFALTMFARITAPTEAATTAAAVKASTITGIGTAKIQFAAKAIKTCSTVSAHTARIAVAAMIIPVTLTIALAMPLMPANVKSVHYTVQGVTPADEKQADSKKRSVSSVSSSSSNSAVINKAGTKYNSKGAYETKLFMPAGPEGPVLRFDQRWNTEQDYKLCSWLQDGSGNYYYASHENKIYITNDPLRMLIMPNDSPELTNFIFSQTYYDTRVSYKRKFFSDLTKDTVDNRVTEYPDFKCRYSYNTLTNADIAATWPETADVEDMRDIMHKRGWTFFKVTGHMNKKQITGQGQMPFVYNHYKENLPWISLQVGNDKYTDYPGNKAIAETENNTFVFDKETFFTGFCRPWQGLACIDSVRRDAAKRRLKFTTTTIAEKAIITVFANTAKGQIAMMYDIDTDTDVINSIKFLKGKDVIGLINFDYMQDLPTETAQNFQPPKTDITPEKTQNQQNIWLTMLTK